MNAGTRTARIRLAVYKTYFDQYVLTKVRVSGTETFWNHEKHSRDVFSVLVPMFHPENAYMVHCLSPKRAMEIGCKCQCVGGPTVGTALKSSRASIYFHGHSTHMFTNILQKPRVCSWFQQLVPSKPQPAEIHHCSWFTHIQSCKEFRQVCFLHIL